MRRLSVEKKQLPRGLCQLVVELKSDGYYI